MAGLRPLPLSVRDPVRFQLDALHNWACRTVVRIGHLGASGKITPKQAPSYTLGLKAALSILERTAPTQKAGVEAHLHGNLVIAWQPSASPSPTLPADTKPPSTTGSKRNGHAPPSSSATDALANL